MLLRGPKSIQNLILFGSPRSRYLVSEYDLAFWVGSYPGKHFDWIYFGANGNVLTPERASLNPNWWDTDLAGNVEVLLIAVVWFLGWVMGGCQAAF